MKLLLVVAGALVLSLGSTTSNQAQPPGGGGCNPVGYIMFCQHTCEYEERAGGGCENQGDEGSDSYCLEVIGVPGVSHDGSGDPCCSIEPLV
jgi:hypothetical protein